MLSEFMRNISLQYKDGIERNVLTLPEIGRVNLVSNMEESLHSFDWTVSWRCLLNSFSEQCSCTTLHVFLQ